MIRRRPRGPLHGATGEEIRSIRAGVEAALADVPRWGRRGNERYHEQRMYQGLRAWSSSMRATDVYRRVRSVEIQRLFSRMSEEEYQERLREHERNHRIRFSNDPALTRSYLDALDELAALRAEVAEVRTRVDELDERTSTEQR